MIALVVAYDKNKAIGKDGKMPWNIPGELKRYRELTTGHTIIMGRKTYEAVGYPKYAHKKEQIFMSVPASCNVSTFSGVMYTISAGPSSL